MVAFAEVRLPIAVKAAHGGGGRAWKVARTIDENSELYESAVRRGHGARSASVVLRGALSRQTAPRRAQVIADQHGNVVVAGTRDCSLQRRYQKLVEEAPAPVLTDSAKIHDSAKRVTKRPITTAPAPSNTCVVGQDGLISFLEVNTRLQVEHPVTEKPRASTWCCLIRIANGES